MTAAKKISASVKKLVKQIYNNESHRASQSTYQDLIDLGFARYVSWQGWELTEFGTEIAKKLSQK